MKAIKILSHLITSSLFLLIFAGFLFIVYKIASEAGQLLTRDIAPNI